MYQLYVSLNAGHCPQCQVLQFGFIITTDALRKGRAFAPISLSVAPSWSHCSAINIA